MIQAYSSILESLPVKRDTKYPVSKKGELKKVYNDIVNLSRRSPFYKINLSKENKDYTIGVKETAMTLKVKLEDMMKPEISGFHSKAVTVSDEQILSAKLLVENTQELPDSIHIKVRSLASVQVNRGKELLQISKALSPGEYDFQAKVMEDTYALTYTQGERTENQEALQRMADFLNQSVPGINALVERGSSNDYSRLTIVADTSGRFGDKGFRFEEPDNYRRGIVEFFGMNRIEKVPTFAQFELEGLNKQTATNTFTLENKLQITLRETSEQPVNIRIVPDSEKILNAVADVLNSYNRFIHLAKEHTMVNAEHYKAAKLMNEMIRLEKQYKEELTACGIKASEDGELILEEALAVQASEDGKMESLFTRENGFIARLLEKTEAIAINPFEYLDKTIVTYPNQEKNTFRNPYITSMYSGLLYSSYC